MTKRTCWWLRFTVPDWCAGVDFALTRCSAAVLKCIERRRVLTPRSRACLFRHWAQSGPQCHGYDFKSWRKGLNSKRGLIIYAVGIFNYFNEPGHFKRLCYVAVKRWVGHCTHGSCWTVVMLGIGTFIKGNDLSECLASAGRAAAVGVLLCPSLKPVSVARVVSVLPRRDFEALSA